MIKWTDDGEDRFIIRSEYNAGLQKISSLGLNVFNALEKVLSKNPGPVLEEVSLLGTLDIFAGCGGLSTGLGQAGVADSRGGGQRGRGWGGGRGRGRIQL